MTPTAIEALKGRVDALELQIDKWKSWIQTLSALAAAFGLTAGGAAFFLWHEYRKAEIAASDAVEQVRHAAPGILKSFAPDVIQTELRSVPAVFCENSGGTLADADYAPLKFPTCEYGKDNVDSSSGHWTFVAPRAGVYLVQAALYWDESSAKPPNPPTVYNMFLKTSKDRDRRYLLASVNYTNQSSTLPLAAGSLAIHLVEGESIWVEAVQRNDARREIAFGSGDRNYIAVTYLQPQ